MRPRMSSSTRCCSCAPPRDLGIGVADSRLSSQKLRQSWNKYNLYNLYRNVGRNNADLPGEAVIRRANWSLRRRGARAKPAPHGGLA